MGWPVELMNQATHGAENKAFSGVSWCQERSKMSPSVARYVNIVSINVIELWLI